MRFEVFHRGLLGRRDIVAVDMIHYAGLWGMCFSHHVPNNNHPRYAADTTTAGVLRFLASEDPAPLADYTITTHHLDADALLPVWALLNPRQALERRDLLERVARCGDFFIYIDDESARLNFIIEAIHRRLRDYGARGERLIDDALTRRCFEWLLPRWGDLLADSSAEEDLWRQPMQELLADLDYLAAPGRLAELWEHHASLIVADHAPDAHALNSACRNDLLVIWRTDAPERRIEVRPALGWYDIQSLPHRPRYGLDALAARLNDAERAAGASPTWLHDPGPAWLTAESSALSQERLLDELGSWLAAEPDLRVPAAYRSDLQANFRHWPRHAIYTSHARFAGAPELRFAPGAPYGGLYPVAGFALNIAGQGLDIAGALALLPPAEGAPQSFAVSDDFYWNRRAPEPLELRVTYEDRRAGRMWAEYDAWRDPCAPTAPAELRGDGATREAVFTIPDARMGNSQDGGDLRLIGEPESAFVVKELALRKVTP